MTFTRFLFLGTLWIGYALTGAVAFPIPATYQEIPIAVLAGTDQKRPTISSHWIAWEDDRTWPGVYGVWAENRQTGDEFLVSPDPVIARAYHGAPRLSGDTILWQGNPNTQGTLFYDDLSNRNSQLVFPQSIDQFQGDIHGDLVVWQESEVSPLVEGNLYGSYLGSGSKFLITESDEVFIAPVTDGQFIVWREWIGPNRQGLFYKDLLTGQSSILSDRSPTPAIDAGILVYPDTGGIAVRNLVTGESSLISVPAVTLFSVAISGDLVVYGVLDSAVSEYDLWGARISTGETFVISDAPGNQYWADVHGNFVVWSDDRTGDFDVYGAIVPEPSGLVSVVAGLGCLVLRRKTCDQF